MTEVGAEFLCKGSSRLKKDTLKAAVNKAVSKIRGTLMVLKASEDEDESITSEIVTVGQLVSIVAAPLSGPRKVQKIIQTVHWIQIRGFYPHTVPNSQMVLYFSPSRKF